MITIEMLFYVEGIDAVRREAHSFCDVVEIYDFVGSQFKGTPKLTKVVLWELGCEYVVTVTRT